jgi:hypothetical protein
MIFATQAANRALQAFWRGVNGHVYTAWQSGPNGAFGSWTDLGGGFAGNPVVIKATNGALQVFVMGSDGSLRSCWQSGPGGALGGWATLSPSGTRLATGGSGLSVNMATNGVLQVFGIRNDTLVWTTWQAQALGPFRSSTTLARAPNPSIDNQHFAGVPGCARAANGSFQVFVLDHDGRLYTAWQPAPLATFGGWSKMADTRWGGSPAVSHDADGSLRVFTIDAYGHLQTAVQAGPNGTFGGFTDLGGDFIGTPAAAFAANNTVEVFATGADGAMYTTSQQAPGGAFASPFTSLGGDLADSPSVAVSANGALQVFCTGRLDNRVYSAWQSAPLGAFGSITPIS